MNVKSLFILSVFLLPHVFPNTSHAQNGQPPDTGQGNDGDVKVSITTAMEEMLLFFDESDLITTATKHVQPLREAPAIATVITADEIRNMGARDIIDVLRTVPGIGVTKGYYGKEEIEVRGIKTVNSEKVKLLIDGHSVNDNLSGGAIFGFDSLSVDNVKRIEIVRGPGSALYGSNAFSAVINVVTKDGKDIDGVIVSGGGGSFDTGKANLQAGKMINDFDVAVSLDYLHTLGPRLKIDKDVLGRSGDTKDFEDRLDAGLTIAYKDFAFNSKLMTRQRGAYVGVQYAVTEGNQVDVQQYFGELSYRHSFNENVKLLTKAYIDEMDWKAHWEILPKGTGPFFAGMIGVPSMKERTLGAELQLDCSLLSNNILTFGAMDEKRDQFHVGYAANYDPRDFTPLPSGLVQDVASLANWNQEKTRDIWAAYIQDVWDITDKVALTVGLRHDHYSDFGESTNPRAAIVWKFLKGWDLKLLYGEAFRAPSFEELYNMNNPAVLGNNKLTPERMKTYEASLGYTNNSNTKARISYFNNTFDDKIQLISQSTPGTFMFENTGGAKVYGIEAEVKQEFAKDTYFYANYTYQEPKDKDTDKRLPDVPIQKGNIGANIGLTKYLNANSNIFISVERPRAEGDTRNAVPAYALVDLTLIAKDFYRNIEVRGSVHNLLDKRYADPAPTGTIQDDFPREGISFMLEALYKY